MHRFFTVAVIAFSTAAFASCGDADKPANDAPNGDEPRVAAKQDGPKAPDFTLESIEGEDVSLSDFEGKVVLIDFWATWCPPCREGVPDLVALNEELGEDFVVIGVSLDGPETVADVVPFAKNHEINYPVMIDYNRKAVRAYSSIPGFKPLEAIPTAYLINKDGVVVDQLVGLHPKPTLKEKIEALM